MVLPIITVDSVCHVEPEGIVLNSVAQTDAQEGHLTGMGSLHTLVLSTLHHQAHRIMTIDRRISKYIVWLALLLAGTIPISTGWAQTLPRALPEDVGMSSERLERLTEAMQAYVDQDRLAGIVIQVIRHGKTAYLESFGEMDRELGVPMAENVIFRIASQSKAIVSIGSLILQEEGKLLISDPVGKFIPEFMSTTVAVPDEDGGYTVVDVERPITIRDLLTHTSGVSYGYGPASDRWEEADIQNYYFSRRDEPILETVKRMAGLPFDLQPGTEFLYGYSTDILGAVLEVASDMALDEFLEDRIFEPLQMTDTHFYLPEEKRGRLSTVYAGVEGGGIEPAEDPGLATGQGAFVDGPRKSFSGGAGLLSTANDYARFLQMLLNGGELEGARVLSPTTVRLILSDHLTDVESPWNQAAGFGLGFYVVKDVGAWARPSSVGEFGWGGAYHSTYWADPSENLVVVYFTQLVSTQGIDDHRKLRALIYQAIVE